MPLIKIDHIISFSSEDSVHVANNILNNDPAKKWKCQTVSEKSASIILQLEKATEITSIDIGNEHSAYVEVLVSRSTDKDDFKVLLVMSSFMTPLESRQSVNINKVRMFGYNELQSPERDQKWDRVKIVCTQPFNRHVQYGLSFITLHSSENKNITSTAPSLKLGNFSLRPSSPDNLSVGSLFSRRKELLDDQPLKAAAAIREASSSNASLQGSPKCKPKLKVTTSTPTSSSKKTPAKESINDTQKARNRNELLYNEDEEKPNGKIDKLVEQRKKEREKNNETKEQDLKNTNNKGKRNSANNQMKKENNDSGKKQDTPGNTSKRKLNYSNTPSKKVKPSKPTKPFDQLLSGVTIVVSGIQNPERATIRNEALAMGAKYRADWDNTCTHLICAFTNTPKFNQVKGKGKIVNRLWISDCHSQRKRLPWRRYALDIKDQTKAESEDEIWEQLADSPEPESMNEDSPDTEDEIERIQTLQKTKKKSTENTFSAETDEEISHSQSKNVIPELPDFLGSKILYIDAELSESLRSRLRQYITAYNGLILDEPSDIVNYAVSSVKASEALRTLCPDAEVVKPDWIWECHNTKQLVSTDNYKY